MRFRNSHRIVCTTFGFLTLVPQSFDLQFQSNDSECEVLANSIREILWKAIEAGGSSLRDFKKVGGDLGYFQNSFSVYSREGLKCKRDECGSNIQRVNQSGRSTFFCSKCQQ